jgi:ABC-2 type transport system ATP-binding protein
LISVKNLTFDYPGKRALQHVSFTIEAGSITALVGPNGAGKSTLMRCLAALDTPSSGSIHIASLDVLENPREAHALMGYLPDFFGLYEDLSVEQCLYYHAMVQNIPKQEQKAAVERVAQRMQIQDLLFQEAKTLSRGESQRLAIAQAIIHHPSVLILDEPASGLDPEARYHLSQLLVLLAQEGITMLVSSHILSELEDYCTHMLVLREGRVVKHCAIDESSKRMIDIYLETSH